MTNVAKTHALMISCFVASCATRHHGSRSRQVSPGADDVDDRATLTTCSGSKDDTTVDESLSPGSPGGGGEGESSSPYRGAQTTTDSLVTHKLATTINYRWGQRTIGEGEELFGALG